MNRERVPMRVCKIMLIYLPDGKPVCIRKNASPVSSLLFLYTVLASTVNPPCPGFRTNLCTASISHPFLDPYGGLFSTRQVTESFDQSSSEQFCIMNPSNFPPPYAFLYFVTMLMFTVLTKFVCDCDISTFGTIRNNRW